MENHEALTAERTLPARTASSVRDVLIEARKLIERPEDWSPKGWGSGGKRCAAHAIGLIAPNEDIDWEAQDLVQRVVGKYLGDFNDTHTHGEVLAAFDRAIELAGAQSGTDLSATPQPSHRGSPS